MNMENIENRKNEKSVDIFEFEKGNSDNKNIMAKPMTTEKTDSSMEFSKIPYAFYEYIDSNIKIHVSNISDTLFFHVENESSKKTDRMNEIVLVLYNFKHGNEFAVHLQIGNSQIHNGYASFGVVKISKKYVKKLVNGITKNNGITLEQIIDLVKKVLTIYYLGGD